MRCYLTAVFVTFLSTCEAQLVARSMHDEEQLHAGMTNYISLSVGGLDSRFISVSVSSGKIVKHEKDGVYEWTYCDSLAQYEILKVYYKKSFFDSARFRVVRVPNHPIAVGGYQLSGSYADTPYMAVPRFRAQREIVADFTGCYMSAWINDPVASEVVSFRIKLLRNDSTLADLPNTGEAFSEETREAFRLLQPGDKVVFYDLVIRNGCESIPRKYTAEYFLFLE